jgi:hypothetical protein
MTQPREIELNKDTDSKIRAISNIDRIASKDCFFAGGV